VPILPPSVDYADKDFDALRQRLIALIGSAFPDWSDFSVASFGNVLLEMYAFVGDVLGYYLDNQARESRLATATQRKNVIALARMLGCRLQGAQAAKAKVSLSLQAPPSADVTLPTGTIVRTQEVTEPARFQLLAPVVISAGTSPPLATGVAENSETHTQLFDARGLASLDVHLDRVPYLDGSAYIDKMSDYCDGWRFDPKKTCPYPSLYWAYLGRHSAALACVDRMKLPVLAETRRSPERSTTRVCRSRSRRSHDSRPRS